MPGKKGVSEDPVTNLARGIASCDAIRAYRRRDLASIDETFDALKKTRFREYNDLWLKARPSAERIVNMPLKIEGVKRMIGALSWAKVSGRVSLIVLAVLVAVQFVPSFGGGTGGGLLGENAILYTLICVVVTVALFNLGSVLDYVIRKRIIAYEDATADEYAPYRDKMKDCVNRMMKALAREVERGSESQEDLSMVLYFDDYDNTRVVDHWKPKAMWLIKKTYDHYKLVPEP